MRAVGRELLLTFTQLAVCVFLWSLAIVFHIIFQLGTFHVTCQGLSRAPLACPLQARALELSLLNMVIPLCGLRFRQHLGAEHYCPLPLGFLPECSGAVGSAEESWLKSLLPTGQQKSCW